MQLQKFTAKYHVPQEAIQYSELNIITSTITELNLSWENAFSCNSWNFSARTTFSTSVLVCTAKWARRMKLKPIWLLLAPVSVRPLAGTPLIHTCTFTSSSSDSRNGRRVAGCKSPLKSLSIGAARDCWRGRCNERHTLAKCPFLPHLWQTQFFAGQFPRRCRRTPQKKHCCVCC